MADEIVLPPESETETKALPPHRPTHQVNINAQMQMYLGPFPSPDVLERYEKVAPGMTERMLVMVEKQSDHRLKLESAAMDHHRTSQNRGQWFAFIMGMTSIIGGIALLAFGKQASGLAAIITPAISGVIAYGIGKSKTLRDLAEKRARQNQFMPQKSE